MKIIRAILFFILPSFVLRFFSKLLGGEKFVMKKDARIGFSIVMCDNIILEENARIGHFNFIRCKKTMLYKNSSIRHLNFIKGNFSVIIGESGWINLQNKISANPDTYQDVTLTLEREAKIGVRHLLDMTDSITLGEFSMLAGTDTQIWTHSFLFSQSQNKFIRLDAPVHIGSHCYIGARSTILSGVKIGKGITIGASTCVSKSIEKQGLYISQNLVYKEFDPDEKMRHLGNPDHLSFIFKRKNVN